MGIISSNYTIDVHNQTDGNKYVTEFHTDNLGNVYKYGPYKISSESLVSDLLNARIQKIDSVLAEAEFEKLITINAAINLSHQTGTQFASRFWDKVQQSFSNGNKVYFCYLIWWIYNRVSAGDFSSNDVRLSYNSFFNKSLNLTQWNNLVNTRLIPAKDRYQAILDEGQI